jgi:hypothetical protein
MKQPRFWQLARFLALLLLAGLVAVAGGLWLFNPRSATQQELYQLARSSDPAISPGAVRGSGLYWDRQESRDRWIQIPLGRSPWFAQPLQPGNAQPCTPAETDQIRAWFLAEVSPKGWLPWPQKAPAPDRIALSSSQDLQCRRQPALDPNQLRSLGQPPRGSALDWQLYHTPTRRYYRREACADC